MILHPNKLECLCQVNHFEPSLIARVRLCARCYFSLGTFIKACIHKRFGSDNFAEWCDLNRRFSYDTAAIYTNVLTCLYSQILDLARNAWQGQTQGDIAIA